MKIEMELKIKQGEEDKDNDDSNTSFISTSSNQEKHEVLFSSETSSLYSSTRMEAKYDYDYEINLIQLIEDNEIESLYIIQTSKLL